MKFLYMDIVACAFNYPFFVHENGFVSMSDILPHAIHNDIPTPVFDSACQWSIETDFNWFYRALPRSLGGSPTSYSKSVSEGYNS